MQEKVKELINDLRRVQSIVNKEGFKQLLEASNIHQYNEVEKLCLTGKADKVKGWVEKHPSRGIQMLKKKELRELCSAYKIYGYSDMTVPQMKDALIMHKTRLRKAYQQARTANSPEGQLEAVKFLFAQLKGNTWFTSYNIVLNTGYEKHLPEVHQFLLEFVAACNAHNNVFNARTPQYWSMRNSSDDEVVALDKLAMVAKRMIRNAALPNCISRVKIESV